MRRNLRDNEVDQYTSLLNLLSEAIIMEGVDERRWIASEDGSFSVSSFFVVLNNLDGLRSQVATILKLMSPPRVLVYGWLALQKIILTMDNLRRRGKILVNGCGMCLCEEESLYHLLLNCRMAHIL